jgi:ribosome biogenesis GTPase
MSGHKKNQNLNTINTTSETLPLTEEKTLQKWGWNPSLEEKFNYLKDQKLKPGRIVLESRHLYEIETEKGRVKARVSGHFMYTALNRSEYPTIGDWVALNMENDKAVIEKLIERKSSFSRKRPGVEVEEQIIAANIDYLFLVFALDGGRNFTAGALERFLTESWDSGATPVVLLNKTDLCDDPGRFLKEAGTLSPGVDVYLTSALSGEGLDSIGKYLKPGKTIAFTGFSGVGKSALINKLCGFELMKTGELRHGDLKGKHTTTRKELILMDNGAILIDSPGIKELQLWGNEETLSQSFEDIMSLAELCRFSDCSHSGEPGCAVQNALSSGTLEQRRFENYLQMRKELQYLESKKDIRSVLEEKAKGKKFSKMVKNMKR